MSPIFFCNNAAYKFQVCPKHVLVFDINTRSIKVSETLKFEQEGEIVVLDVRGLIYYGDFHFTFCVIGTDGIVQYHNGMTTWSNCKYDGDFLTSSLLCCFQLQKQENLHKPFEWPSKINTTHINTPAY
jgi:hypothetical protein